MLRIRRGEHVKFMGKVLGIRSTKDNARQCEQWVTDSPATRKLLQAQSLAVRSQNVLLYIRASPD